MLRPLAFGIGPAVIAAALAAAPAAGQLPDVDQSYDIQVTLDMETRTLAGSERIVWRNPASRPLDRVQMHLYLNAFSNGGSTWLKEARLGQGLRFDDDARTGEGWGYDEPTAIRQIYTPGAMPDFVEPPAGDDGEEGVGDETEEAAPAPPPVRILEPVALDASWAAIQPDDGNPLDRTLIEVALPRPVAPGDEVVLEVEFSARLPQPPFARTGCIDDMCFVGQWFPKLAVLETPGVRGATADRWAGRQFHAGTEFYADFADYTVEITTDAGYEIGATGRRVAEAAGDETQTVTYEQRAVTDFAFTVGDFDVYESAWDAPGRDPDVDVRYLVYAGKPFDLERAREAVHGGLQVMNARVGTYPYDVLTVVYPPIAGAAVGGMEYPTLFTGIAADDILFKPPLGATRFFELVDIHEFGHQYFQHLLATNEQTEAFMDEGFNSYWEGEILEDLYGLETSNGSLFGRPIDHQMSTRLMTKSSFEEMREPIAKRPSSLFEPGTGGNQIYARSAVVLQTAEGLFGQDVMDGVFQAYFEEWKFRHPQIDDFLDVAGRAGGAEVEAFLREAFFTAEHPDFAVDLATTAEFAALPGRYVGDEEEAVTIETGDFDSVRDRVFGDRARETDGRVWAEVTDPGWADEAERRDGRVYWDGFAPAAGEAANADVDATFYESRVRITGPAWSHLPVDVVIRFEDGVEIRETWSGRAAWRAYRFVRPSKLESVRLDPENKIMLDLGPKNNSMLLTPNDDLKKDWSYWSGAFVQFLVGAVWGMS